MSGIRDMIDAAVVAAIAEHPKYFTELGLDNSRARTAIVRKIMAALRGDSDKSGEPAKADAPPPPAPAQSLTVAADSREARAYTNLRKFAGAVAPFRMADGSISINAEAACEAVWPFADLPPSQQWPFLTQPRQVGAWLEFFAQTLPGAPRRPIQQIRDGATGIVMPWLWPPAKDGKTYTAEEDAA